MSSNDNKNPYNTPANPYSPGLAPMQSDSGDVRSHLKALGIFFLILGIVGFVGGLGYSILTMIGLAADPSRLQPPPNAQEAERIGFYIGAYGVIGLMFLNSLLQIIVIAGGVSLLSLKGRTTAILASILCLLPCVSSPCCVVGVPFGVWGLIVLRSASSKQCFS
jgi:hypothetical protein